MDDRGKKKQSVMTIALTMNDVWASMWSFICGVIEQMRVHTRNIPLPAETPKVFLIVRITLDGGYVRNPKFNDIWHTELVKSRYKLHGYSGSGVSKEVLRVLMSK